MFDRTLTEKLRFAEQYDRYAVLARDINEQLDSLSKISISNMRRVLGKYYKVGSENFELLKNAAEENGKKRPLLFCCYALVTNNIDALDKSTLEQTINWLSIGADKNPHFESFLDSLLAIQAVKNYDLITKIALPENCYINLAGAILPDANLTNVDLSYANLAGANLREADLSGADLTNALMDKHTDLTSAKMQQTCLSGVRLIGSMKHADLTGADLRNAKLCNMDLDLTGVTLTEAQMDASTQFFYVKKHATPNVYNKYVAEKKAMLSQVKFIDESQFENTTALNRALVHLYLMLKNNHDFPLMQECIAHDLIIRAQMLLEENPDLANLTHELCDVAYVNPMFEHGFGLFRAVNEAADTLLPPTPGEERVIESVAQERLRVTMGGR